MEGRCKVALILASYFEAFARIKRLKKIPAELEAWIVSVHADPPMSRVTDRRTRRRGRGQLASSLSVQLRKDAELVAFRIAQNDP